MHRVLAPAALVIMTCALLAGCATSPADAAAAPTATADPGNAAGIVLADPNAPDPAVAAKRRAPEAVGAVVAVTFGEDSVQVEFAPDAGYEYFEGTTFDIPFSAATAIDGETALVLGDLQAGDRINVWTTTCAESFPVQCVVEAATAG